MFLSLTTFKTTEMHENRNSFKYNCPTTVRANDAYCPITQAWRVLSSYIVLLMLKSGLSIANQIGEFCHSFDSKF